MRREKLSLLAAVVCAIVLAGSWGVGTRAQTQPPSPPGAQAADSAGPQYDPMFLTALKWRNIGPNRGGRSIGVAGSAARPLEYYFGATGGGLWKTTDGGTTWKPAADAYLRTSSVGAVAVSESNPDVVYVGMGETELRGNVIQGDGVYKTADGGKTWKNVGLADTQNIARIRVHPSNPDIVFVAAFGHTYAPNPERGVFRSTDGGATWKKVLFRNDKAGAVDLCLDPADPQVVYAALWEAFRTSYSLSSGGPSSGLFKSSDGGDSWSELTRNPGLPKGIVGKIGVAASGGDAHRVYAIVEAEDGGIFRSDDAGATWTKVNDERRFRQRAFYYSRIYADPKAKDTLYVLNTGFYRSTDAGKTWKAIRVPHGDNHDLWIAANDPQRMINGNDGGANVSFNGGETWTGQRYPTAQLYHVTTTAHVPYHVCGAQQDNSTACVPVNGNGDEFYDVGGGESGYIAADPRNPDVFYAGSYGGLLTRYDRRTGQMREINVWPENPMGHSSNAMKERFQWTFPIVFSPTDPNVLYVGSQHLWRTTDEGQHWERLGGDLTRADPSTLGPSGGPITLDQTGVETYATIFTIAPSPADAATIWTGSDDGYVQVTRDGGKTWANVTPPDLPPFARISLIDASRHDKATAYVAANRYQSDDRSPYFYRTHDYGKSWTKITTDIPASDFARAIREDPRRAGLLYAGTETGIYVSFDDGSHWQPLRQNLPVTPVHDIALAGNDLVIATHGRSLYVMDDVAVLRQLTPAVQLASARLFTPEPATRSVSRGVSIDYYLQLAPAGVTVDILDPQGAVIRTFTANVADEKDKSRAGASEEAPPDDEGPRGAPPKPPLKQGLNRFTWDMRHAGPTEIPKMILWAAGTRGPRAAPGAYKARLTVALKAGGSTTLEAPFVIKPHPLLANVSDADLRAQFQLAMDIRDSVSRADEAVNRIRSIKAQLKDRADTGRNARLSAAADALMSKLTAVEGEIYQYRNQSSQDPLNYPIKLNNKLAALLGVVDSADGRPPAQCYDAFKDLSGRLDAELARLGALEKGDLAAFNTLARAAKLEPVAAK
jgi:photosystem II stability/assembly factor-like uncharacterized protein